MSEILEEIARLTSYLESIQRQEAQMITQVDLDRFRLEIVYLNCRIMASRALYDLVEFKRDHFGEQVNN